MRNRKRLESLNLSILKSPKSQIPQIPKSLNSLIRSFGQYFLRAIL